MPFSFGTKLSLSAGNYEFPERILCSLVLEKGMNILEIGTSIGILTGIMASKIGSQGKIVTIEASQKNFKIACSWLLKQYPNIKIVNGYGFPCSTIPKDLYVNKFNESISNLGGEVQYSFNNSGIKSSNDIPTLGIKTIEKVYLKDKADLLLADIEGAENILLKANTRIPATLKHIIIETHPWKYTSKEDVEKIISKICSCGFKVIHNIATCYLFSRNLKS